MVHLCHGKTKDQLPCRGSHVPASVTDVLSRPQAVFSSVFYFASVSLYQGFLMVG